MRGQFINSCLSRSICFFATNSSQFFHVLAICCATCSEVSISQFQSLSTIIFPFEPDLPIDSPDKAPIVEIRVRDVSRKGQYQKSSFPIFSCPFMLQLRTIFSELFFLTERLIQLSVPGTCRDFVSLSAFAQR